ncbi:MAG: hypothetical protein CSA26_07235 [Desulfobacterales bacterium]|nr:MAG: hypothetical protein CSA26_07235 [Desulfobacterales bacterium]
MGNDKKTIELTIRSDGYRAGLRGRQSVRTTFKLTPRCIDALSVLSGQLGIKQKSLFDHIIDDMQRLKSFAGEFESTLGLSSARVPKTYVISRKTLDILEQVSKEYRAPRDALVEFSIERIMPLIQEEKKKHERRKRLLDRVGELDRKGRELLEEASRVLDQDDPVLDRIYLMYRAIDNGCNDVNGIIDKGRRLEGFDL